MRAADAVCFTIGGITITAGVLGLLLAFWPVGLIALGVAVLAVWFFFIDEPDE